MCARNDDDHWYLDYDDCSDSNDSDDDECIVFNYDDFLKYQNKFSPWSPTDESEDEECDFDESYSERHNVYNEQYYIPDSGSRPATQGGHSCLKLRNEYCYLDPSVYDTRVMRNLSTMDDLPRGSYSPKFIQAALEKTKSLTSWTNNDQIDDFVDYDNMQTQNSDRYYCDYPQPRQPQIQTTRIGRHTGLKTMVENLIYDTKVVIFSKTYCPYCVMAKNIFDNIDQPYIVIELDQRPDGDQIQKIMEQITGGTSVPRVFVDNIFIGGGDDVKRLYESGELEEMLDFE